MSQVMVGLHRVGLVGLRQALERVDGIPVDRREEILDRLVDELRRENFVPEAQLGAFRTALWRELLRRRGEDFSAFFSEVPVTITGASGADGERFEALVVSVFADFELRPVVTRGNRTDDGAQPVLRTGDHEIARGLLHRERLKAAVRQSFSDW